MAIEHTSRGVPYPDGDEPNNVPLYMELLAGWVNDHTISSDDLPDAAVGWADVADKPATFPPATHNHDTRYYTEAEVNDFFTASDAAVATKAPKASPTLTGTTTIGGADTDVLKLRAAVIENHDRNLTPTYTAGKLTSIAETDGATPVGAVTIGWTDGLPTSVAITIGGITATDTLTFSSDGTWTGHSRSIT
jgi:hypothetical protein